MFLNSTLMTGGMTNYGQRTVTASLILQFFMSYIWLSIVPSLRKIWIVHSFQGNYRKI